VIKKPHERRGYIPPWAEGPEIVIIIIIIIDANNTTTARPKLEQTSVRYRRRECSDSDYAVKLRKVTFIYFNIISVII
jgi:hypothetical protein